MKFAEISRRLQHIKAIMFEIKLFPLDLKAEILRLKSSLLSSLLVWY